MSSRQPTHYNDCAVRLVVKQWNEKRRNTALAISIANDQPRNVGLNAISGSHGGEYEDDCFMAHRLNDGGSERL
jgi:hypothetical protein